MTDVASLISGQNASLANGQAQMASDFSQINSASQAIVQATQAAGTDEGVIATQQAQGLLDAQNAARQVAASYGGNPDDVSSIMNQLGQKWQTDEAEKDRIGRVIDQKQSVSFFDDPLQWFTNKLSINADINHYNDTEELANSEYTQLTRINSLNTQTADSMKAIAKTQTAATVSATADLAAQKTAIAAKQASIQGLLYNVKGVQDINQMGQEQVSNSVQGAQVAIAAGHLAVAQQQVKIMSEEYGMKAALYAQEIKDKQTQDASDQSMLDAANRGRAVIGLPALPSTKIYTLVKAGGEVGEQAKQWIQTGLTNDATGKPIIAPTSGTAARILATNNSPLAVANPAVKSVTGVLADSYNFARNPQNQAQLGVNPKDVSTLDNAVSGLVQQRVGQMASNIKAGDQSNIFQAPPLTALAQLPSVKDNPLYQKVLAPQVKAGMAETDPSKLISITMDAVQQKQISLQDAANGLANLFQSAAAMNTQTKDFMRFGIAPQANYNTDVDFTGVFGGVTRVDMTNKAQVATALMKAMANNSRLQSLQMGGGQ